MDALYVAVLLLIGFVLYQTYGPWLVKATGLDDDKTKLGVQYPSLFECIERFPDEEKVYKELCYKYLRRFIDAYEKSYDPKASTAELSERMQHAKKKVESYMHEIIFRIPNDIHLEKRLRASAELACLFLDTYAKDVRLRASRHAAAAERGA
jgi:hypothetical protein